MKRKHFLLVFIYLIHLPILAQVQLGLMAGPQFSTREYKFGSAHNGLITSINAGVMSSMPYQKSLSYKGHWVTPAKMLP